jgi:uncharacterized protein (DUF433 family)
MQITTEQTTTDEIDWSGLPLIRREPGKIGGVPNIDGMRITPETIVDHWEGGMDIPEILSHFGGVSYDQAYAILEYAQRTGQIERPFKH